MPWTMAICLLPDEVRTLLRIIGGKSECICWGTLSSCSFQRICMFFTFWGLRMVSFFCQAVRKTSAPSMSQSLPAGVAWEKALPQATAAMRIDLVSLMVIFL